MNIYMSDWLYLTFKDYLPGKFLTLYSGNLGQRILLKHLPQYLTCAKIINVYLKFREIFIFINMSLIFINDSKYSLLNKLFTEFK